MARSQEDWDERIQKHGNGIDVDKATQAELEDYIATKIHVHIAEDFTDFTLWDCAREELQGFTVDIFKKLRVDVRSKLRKHLIQRGVFVATANVRYTNSHALYDAFQGEEYHQWTDEDLKVFKSADSFLITSRMLQKRMDIQTESPHPTTPVVPPNPQTHPTTPAVPPNPQTVTYPPISPLGSVPPFGSQFNAPETPRYPQFPSHEPATPHFTPPFTAPQTHQFGNPLQFGNPQPGPTTYSKEVATVAKLYSDDQKYDGIGDSFDFKLTIFYDICRRSGLPQEGYISAFPTMLKGLAQDHYYNSHLSTRPFLDVCSNIRQFFEGPEYYRKNLTQWNAVSLQSVLDEHSSKSTYQCFQILIEKLLKLRHGIHPEFRTDLMYTNKLITACQGVEACRIAISNPSSDIASLINSIQSSIVAWEKENPRVTTQETFQTDNTEAFYTDRKYHRNDRNRDRNRGRDRPYERRKEYRPSRRTGKCYVCQKENCRSWKHTDKERKKARDEYQRRFDNKGKGNFDEQFHQYTVYCEGDEDDQCNEAFEALILDSHESTDEDEEDECFLTSFGTLAANDAISTSIKLADRAYAHSLDPEEPLYEVEPEEDPFNYNTTTPGSRYSSTEFVGIMIDTGASKKSTAGYGQFQALQMVDPSVTLDISTKGQINVQFGIGTTSSIGSTDITSPIGRVRLHIVQADTPFLLCLADLDRLEVYFNNLKNTIITPTGEVPVVRRFGHPFLLWDTSLKSYLLTSFDVNPCYLTDVELRRLHRRFGHPSVERLHKLLHSAGHDDVEIEALNQLTKFCYYCQKFGKSPGRFRFTLREQDDVNFNFNIVVDVMYINNSPVLHVVDEATRFQAGRWLQDISAKHTWDTLRLCWIDTYLGPPDQITHDAGKNFISKEFKHYATTMGVETKGVPVEAHNSIGMVERYHGPLRRAYQIIAAELPGLDKSMALQMAFKALNDSVGPGGLIPTLLVFGAYPRLVESDPPSPSVTQ